MSRILENGVKIRNVKERCDFALNGMIAFEKVVENVKSNEMEFCDYDLILMDCHMPVLDGYKATSRIREYLYEL